MLDAARARPTAAQRMAQRRPTAPGPGFVPLPPPAGPSPYRIDLAQRLPAPSPERLAFHCVGDTGGHLDPRPQRRVAAALAAEPGVDLLMHLGDVVYPHGEADHYRAQFEQAYAAYPGSIFAVPGNHDAENGLWQDELALAPFLAHFCSATPPLHEAGVAFRPPARQPHVHFTLVHELVRIVGLWSNVPEGGQFDDDQVAWLIGELADTPLTALVILALHQPVFSADDTHGANLALADLFDLCAREAGREPDAVLCGHAHVYQRFGRRCGDREVPYVVAGAGGYPELHPLASGIGPLPHSFPQVPGVTLRACQELTYGFLTVTVAPDRADAVYTVVGSDGTARPADAFAISRPSAGGSAASRCR